MEPMREHVASNVLQTEDKVHGLRRGLEIADNLPAGIEEANSYKDLPGYIMDYIPKLFTVLVPFKLFKGFMIRTIKKHQDRDPSKRLLYATDSVTIGGKSYLFFCTSDGCEGVATANNPAGPFEKPVRITMDKSEEPIRGIDPAVFHDDDGKVYLYWGQIGSSVVFDGNSEADLSYKVAENGELTIFIEANKRFEIKSFSLK